MIRSLPTVLAALLIAGVTGCSPTIGIHSEHDPAASFATAQTYDWTAAPTEEGRSERKVRELLDWQIHRAVDDQLVAKGFRRAIREPPDFLVGYRIALQQRTTDSISDYVRYRQLGGTGGPQDTFVTGYEEGTLIVEILDGATQRLAYRASAAGVATPDGRAEQLDQAVQQMLVDFPPR